MSDSEPIGVGGEKAAEIGSARLALALANQDVLGIGQALRHDYVVAPILRAENGEPQILVTTSTDPSDRQFVLPLYSSAHTLQLASQGADRTEFALRHGASLVEVLEANDSVIQWVAFDQAGPNPMWASADDVRSSLEPRLGDDDVAWAASAGSALELDQLGAESAMHPDALDFAALNTWVGVDVTHPAALAAGVTRAAAARFPRFGSGRKRVQEEQRLLEVAQRAADVGARTLMVAAPADDLVVVVRWHEIGPAFGAESHLDRMVAGWPAVDVQLHRLNSGNAASQRVSGGVDFWLEFPDGRGLCQLEFRGTNVFARATKLVASAVWAEDDQDPAEH